MRPRRGVIPERPTLATEDRLIRWGKFCAALRSKGLGYPSQSAFVNQRVDNDRQAFAFAMNDELSETDLGVRLLDPEHIAVLLTYYTHGGNINGLITSLGMERRYFYACVHHGIKDLHSLLSKGVVRTLLNAGYHGPGYIGIAQPA